LIILELGISNEIPQKKKKRKKGKKEKKKKDAVNNNYVKKSCQEGKILKKC
jgi:hypothetical protein